MATDRKKNGIFLQHKQIKIQKPSRFVEKKITIIKSWLLSK
ncbi:hypothetical protein DU19_0061 [Chlamydia muridarum]|nr:hypothetical protein TAC_00305 [Chlamydia muridarum str. Nigg3 CMUT3-5]AHH23379.1 hypothetical protein Y015_00305 [Chlamydia muridarum str. Nigg CM972]KDU82500.1 hypothetical protein DU19_0061 [Chlamydia muridarum]